MSILEGRGQEGRSSSGPDSLITSQLFLNVWRGRASP